ncbi:MAG: MFS transporter [Methanobacterium sp.]|uniref:MFS transporter n=1 Tax=Methanobacterium sp. TaxID=2164 RepID=UPI003D64FF4D|nr:MFS transporter [Methanobacterium sp.]
MRRGGWFTLIIMSLATFITCFDATFMNVSIQNLIQDLDTTLPFVQAMISIYSLTMACLILPGAKLQDILGRKETFILGAVIYGIGALISTLSVNGIMLLVGWSLLEGIGAAMMIPATVAFLTATYHDEDRTFAFGIWSAVVSIAGFVGPILGGFITTWYSWRYGFAMEIIIIIFMLLYSRKLIKIDPILKWEELDVWGAVLSVLGIFLLVLGILELNNLKRWDIAGFTIIAAIIILVTFYWWQKKRINQGLNPLLNINLFKNLEFKLGSFIKIVDSLGSAGISFVIPVFILTVMDGTAFTAGLALFIPVTGLLIASLTVSRITKIIKPIKVISIGFALAIVGCFILSNTLNLESTLWDIIPGMTLIMFGLGLVIPLGTNLIMSSAGERKESDASGVANVSNTLGSSMGTALIGVILILGVFWGLQTSIQDQFPGKYSTQEINDNLPTWYDQINKTSLSVLKTTRDPDNIVAGRIVDGTIRKSTSITFYSIAFVFFLGLISSLLLWLRTRSSVKY